MRRSGEFETCPDWVPAMDMGQRSARIALKTRRIGGFHHRANWPAKVRNVSTLGSQTTKIQAGFELWHDLPNLTCTNFVAVALHGSTCPPSVKTFTLGSHRIPESS